LYQLPRLRGVDGPAGGFAQLHSPIALDFRDRYPTPQSATQLTAARIEGFCRRRGYSGRRSGAELLHRLRSAPVSASRLGEVVVVAQLIRTQVGVVRALTIEYVCHRAVADQGHQRTRLPRSGDCHGLQAH
jgi:hypothetical protein